MGNGHPGKGEEHERNMKLDKGRNAYQGKFKGCTRTRKSHSACLFRHVTAGFLFWTVFWGIAFANFGVGPHFPRLLLRRTSW